MRATATTTSAGTRVPTTPAGTRVPDLIPARGPLDTARLRSLAVEIAARPEVWAAHVVHDPDQRTYALLHQDDDVTVWLICWSPGHDTGFHDHDLSAAGVAVAEGSVIDERMRAFGAPIARRVEAGEAVEIGPTAIHRMHHAGGAPAVSVHVYSPPLLRTGAYEVAGDGQLLRHAQPGEDALVPVG